MIYPKAQAPLTWTVLQLANERAERWRLRYEAAMARVEELQKEGIDNSGV